MVKVFHAKVNFWRLVKNINLRHEVWLRHIPSLPPGGDESTEAKLGRGYDAARTFLRDNPKVRTELLKHVRKSLKEEKATGGSDE
jgi:hypothetical protein